jgi:hypothetical protein
MDQASPLPPGGGYNLKIELLYIDGCPSKERAERMIQQVIDELGMSANAQVVRTLVSTYAQAEALKFPGSPTIRINDQDIEPDSGGHSEFGLNPRTYKYKGMEQDLPDLRWLKDAVRRAKKDEDEKAMLEREKIEVASFDAKPLPRKYGMSTFKTTKGKKGKKKDEKKTKEESKEQ